MHDLAAALLPWFMGLTVTFGVWLTAGTYAAKYNTLKITDERRISQDAKEYTDAKFILLLSEINRLRDSVEKLHHMQAETLAEVKLLRENT